MSQITLRGNPIQTVGDLPAVGEPAPSFTLTGSDLSTVTNADFDGAYELVKSGRARPVVDTVLPLAEARAAHERLESAEQFGKVVLSIPD